MSSSERRFSVTMSEDDLRPHMRKPKPPKLAVAPAPRPQSSAEISEIEELRKKAEKREAVKREVKRRVEEEEKEKERKKMEEEIRRETEELLAIRAISRAGNNSNSEVPRIQNSGNFQNSMPRLGRRVNNFQYFKWDSDDDVPMIPTEQRPASVRRIATSSSPSRRFSVSNHCELCTLALRSIDKTNLVPTKSAACAHVDAFLAASTSSGHLHHHH